MERPFFSLSKKKRLEPIDYTGPDGTVRVRVLPHPDFGMATIWDADVLTWACSVLIEMRRRGVNDVPRTLHFHPLDLLRTIGRGTGGTEYRLLREALARLQATVVRTNIRARGRHKERQFSWLDDWADTVDEATGQSGGMTLTLSEWVHEGVLMDGGVLAVDPAYFAITGGRARWLYRVARKHAGGHRGEGFAMSLPTLFEKSGAEGGYRRFKFELQRIAARDALPEFHLCWEEARKGRGEPSLRMTRRSALDPLHPAYEVPKRRRRGAT